MPKMPTDEVVSDEVFTIKKEGIEKLEANKFELEKSLKKMEQAIADKQEQIQELREENIRREKLGSSALLKSDIAKLKEEIKDIEKQQIHTRKILEQIKDALFKFGAGNTKEPEEYN